MSLSLCLGPAPSIVVEKFNEFKSIYSSITAAVCALLEKDHLLKTKYRFYQSDVKVEGWEVEGTQADTELALQEIGDRLDSYVQFSRLDSRAAAIEELLMSPDVEEHMSDDDSSVEEPEPEEMEEPVEDGIEGGGIEDEEEEKFEQLSSKKPDPVKKKKRKNRKPKKHKKKHHDDEEQEESESKKKRSRHSRDVWRRAGSKFIGWYVCILCNEKHSSEDEYMKHIEMHGSTHSPACMDCGNYFESMVEYEKHIGNLSKELIYKCNEPNCAKAFQFKCRLECHSRTHSGEIMYKCDDCGHKLSSIRSIIRHTRAKHLNEKPFQCHLCEKAFPIQSQLTRHIKDHISPPHFTCEHCGRMFASRQGHHYHQLDHLGVKPHKCSHCGKAFRNKTDMLNHERIHSGDRPFTCELCGKSFVEKGALRKHRVVHTREKNFVCSNCGKQFGYKCSLDGHLRKCHPDSPSNSLLAIEYHPQQQQQQQPHEKSMDYSQETPSSGHETLNVPTSSHDSSRERGMFPCSIQDLISEQQANNSKARIVTLPSNNGDLLATATAVLKGQQEAARLMKKNQPYRPVANLVHNTVKPTFIDKHIQDTSQVYGSYPIQNPHQRDTIDPDILATVLGQKLPIQAQMEVMQGYNDRMHRDESHSTRYHPHVHQERDSTQVMDNSAAAAAAAAAYNQHRHRQHPVSMSDAMMYHNPVRGHNYRP